MKALVRRQEAVESLASMPGVTSIYGDAANEADVQAAMSGCVAAISTLGGRAGADGERIDYVGNSNVIEQAGILGVERIILVTRLIFIPLFHIIVLYVLTYLFYYSIGCGPTVKALSPEVYRVLEEAIVLKNKAERDLRMYTNLDWTIIRPGGLNSDAPTGKAIFTEDPLVSGMITRADVASLVIKALGATSSCTRKELSAVDPSISNLSSVKPYVV